MTARTIRRALAAAAALCILLTCPAAAGPSAGRRTVRVGLFDVDTQGTANGQNRTVAFEKDYLQAVAEYANWDCIYISAPWKDCLEMARDGRLDVLMDVTRTEERAGWYDFSSEPMGTELCYLYGREGTSLQYGDPAGFDGITVGYEEGGTIIDSFREYAQSAGFTFQAKPYADGSAMFTGLDSGEVDAVVQTSFYDTPPGHVILAKLSPSPVYIITSKARPELKLELDGAMAQLFSYNPGFSTDMYQYHFGGAASQTAGYTQEEKTYLASRPVVYVFYETNWAPFEYDKDGEAAGITPEIIRAVGRDTGIDFRFVLSSSTRNVYQDIGDTADAVMAVSYDYTWANSHDLLVTQPYVSGSIMRVMRRSDGEPRTVAVVADSYLAQKVLEHYPRLKAIEYLNASECMDAVAGGAADCTYLSYYQASYYRSMNGYESFSYQPEENIRQGISLGVTKESDPRLFGILSKSLQRIAASDTQSILNESSKLSEPLSLQLVLRRYPVQMALLFGSMGTLVGLLAILLVSSSNRKRQNVRLAAAMREAEAANSAKSEFLSRMSHDMRTPLNGIIGMTYLTGKLDLPPEAQENLQKIGVSSRFLLNLINDLLDMTKAESGKIELHPEPYPPEEFHRYIDAVIRPLCEGKNQIFTEEVHLPDGVVPVIDKLRVNQIVFNLLSNAVKYTPEGGTIRYTARMDARPGNRLAVRLQAADNGVGMSEKFQSVLFTPFTQEARDDNSEARGSGLGLAITKRLVELMGGTISVESAIGAGSVFTVEFETDCVPAGDGAPADGPDQPAGDEKLLAGRHVLLCEDHPLNQEIAQALLREKGMTVEIADDGQRGVEAFRRSPADYYDVILMDIRMPVMDGYQAARAIRGLSRPDAAAVPILAMSADVLADDIQRCRAAGMNGHIAKPIDPQTLYREIAAAIAARP